MQIKKNTSGDRSPWSLLPYFKVKYAKLKKNIRRHKLDGFPAIFKKNLGNELWVRVVSHELPWS